MVREYVPFLLAFLLFVTSLLLIPFVGRHFKDYVGYLIFIVFIIELPVLVLMSKDALSVLNMSNEGGLFLRSIIRTIASLPTLVFGLVSLCIGLAIIGWVLYNLLIEKLPQYTGSVLLPSLSIGPLLVYWGYVTLKSIIGLEELPENYDNEKDDTYEHEDDDEYKNRQ